MYKKQQIVQKISQISRQRSKLDELYVTLQKTISSYQSTTSTKSVVQMRQNFNAIISELSAKIIERNKELNSLNYRCEKLKDDGENVTSQQRNIESLKQYFSNLKQNLNTQRQKGEQIITQKQRWEIKGDTEHFSQEQVSLLNSHQAARETSEIADGMLSTLQYQEGILTRSKNRMGDVLKNINLAVNITRMVRTRSRQDNKLIIWLTIGLFAEIFFCLFVIKPMIRGE